MSLPLKVAILTGVFAVTTLLAELVGAANLGTSMGIAQVAFTVVLVALLLKR